MLNIMFNKNNVILGNFMGSSFYNATKIKEEYPIALLIFYILYGYLIMFIIY